MHFKSPLMLCAKRWRALRKNMRPKLFFLLLLLQISFLSLAQKPDNTELENFNQFFGKERAATLEDAVDSFDRFIQVNYAEFENSTEQIEAFLKQITQYNEAQDSWILETERNSKIIESFESTGLRKEIWTYGYEDYESKHDFNEVLLPAVPDTTPIRELGDLALDLMEEEIIVPLRKVDPVEQERLEKEREARRLNSLQSNYQGDYVFALLKYSPKESFVYEFTESKYAAGVDISMAILAGAYLYSEVNYNDPLVKRLLVTDFYFWVMNWDVNRKG